MRCDDVRVALSARLDDEDDVGTEADVDAHLTSCVACQSWYEGAVAATRRVRLGLAPAVPDLTAGVVEAVRRPGALDRPARPVVRLALGAVAAIQILTALPGLLFGDPFAGHVHVGRELGAVEVALAIGVLAAAWRPWRAAGMLPVVVAVAIGLAATTLIDIVAGNASVLRELPHLLALVEASLLWRLRQLPLSTTPTRPRRALRRVA